MYDLLQSALQLSEIPEKYHDDLIHKFASIVEESIKDFPFLLMREFLEAKLDANGEFQVIIPH